MFVMRFSVMLNHMEGAYHVLLALQALSVLFIVLAVLLKPFRRTDDRKNGKTEKHNLRLVWFAHSDCPLRSRAVLHQAPSEVGVALCVVAVVSSTEGGSM